MNVLLAAGGPISQWPNIAKQYELYVGIDRGSLFLQQKQLPINIAIGDFDSLNTQERERIFKLADKVVTSPAEKDDTDTQLALDLILREHPNAKVTVVGATGGRIDHFLANFWMVLEPRFRKHSQNIYLQDKQNSISFLLPGEHTITKEADKQYLAFCCLTPVSELTLAKSKYTLDKQEVLYPISYASNEFIGEQAEVSFSKGIIAVIQSKDA
ncbi:thiamine diphosphokinase [Tetragenococcus koreensis]|uniref:Thiamine diphosphokinase n=1 Tax=Tetragenococcus koreensis TaxID=290335 RepID=A0AAN4UDP2_9ENTE|nr:thiamine diphosphokinase [Tetragenococcus koreensis]MDN6279217.1 thiamine diphosphokinase [Lactococcus lactis]AYW46367.1 thiamine diphosphokinase [Tetragenococcus koreensis]MCF1616515.1 thiamine diphosphokinase [Tetragenococcus koreensis]MCF1618667.1 thiamine diphosphokinase [Tetragenococcus koreensis]MCF1621447.1 thiamine diphosphokinase [Tetragenococcus koreensis]